MYRERCGYFDNNRLKTWLPYRRNEDSSALVHYMTQERLLGGQEDKYYTYWYGGPQVGVMDTAGDIGEMYLSAFQQLGSMCLCLLWHGEEIWEHSGGSLLL